MSDNLTNARILLALQTCQQQNKLTEELACIIHEITNRLSAKSEYKYYPFMEECAVTAWQQACVTWNTYQYSKSTNPFAYFLAIIKGVFDERIRNTRCAYSTLINSQLKVTKCLNN